MAHPPLPQPTVAQILQNLKISNNMTTNLINNHETVTSREDIQAAIAKAVELRALHAALMQGNSPANLKYPSPSPATHSRPVSQFAAQDYPVFTPSYEEEPLPGYGRVHHDSRQLSGGLWDEFGEELPNDEDVTSLSDYRRENASSRKGLHPNSMSTECGHHVCPAEDNKLIPVSSLTSTIEFFKSSRRNSLGDLNSMSSCNKCKPATIISETDNNPNLKNNKNSTIVVPLTDSHSSSSLQAHPKSRGTALSWLIPKFKKKHKNQNSPNRAVTEPEDVLSQISKDFGMHPIEGLKKELMEANETRDAALMEVSEMRSSFGDLRQKLEYLEDYCEELKKALRQAKDKNSQQVHLNPPVRGMLIPGDGENSLPVSEEVIVEGFLQIVSEARLSVKQFIKNLVAQIEDSDSSVIDNINALLHPYKLSLTARKPSKSSLYHLEANINQTLYQDFENCMFQKNGTPKFLDPQQDRHNHFSYFVSLRNLSWNEVLKKGTKYYSEELSKFCDQKMSCIISVLNWTKPWPEQLLQAFFVAAKCIWLLHSLAFSFDPPVRVLRVEDNRSFDSHYMEDMSMDRQRSLQSTSRVKIMVMPGFYVHDKVLRCKVLCRYKSVA